MLRDFQAAMQIIQRMCYTILKIPSPSYSSYPPLSQPSWNSCIQVTLHGSDCSVKASGSPSRKTSSWWPQAGGVLAFFGIGPLGHRHKSAQMALISSRLSRPPQNLVAGFPDEGHQWALGSNHWWVIKPTMNSSSCVNLDPFGSLNLKKNGRFVNVWLYHIISGWSRSFLCAVAVSSWSRNSDGAHSSCLPSNMDGPSPRPIPKVVEDSIYRPVIKHG